MKPPFHNSGFHVLDHNDNIVATVEADDMDRGEKIALAEIIAQSLNVHWAEDKLRTSLAAMLELTEP